MDFRYKKIVYWLKVLKIKIWQRIYPYCLSLILLLPISAFSQDQKATKLGLVAELVHLNRQTTQLAVMILNDTNLTAKVKLEFCEEYRAAKKISDQVILQFIADFSENGKSKDFHKIDKLFKEKTIEEMQVADINGSASNYLKALLQYKTLCDQLGKYQQYANIASEVAILMDDLSLVTDKSKLSQVKSIANKFNEAGELEKIKKSELSMLLWALQLEHIDALVIQKNN